MYRNAFSMYFLRFMVNYMLLCMLIAKERNTFVTTANKQTALNCTSTSGTKVLNHLKMKEESNK